jgi:HAD superfamily hydrolase (TIGR01509 family)
MQPVDPFKLDGNTATPDHVEKIARCKEELYQRRVRRNGIAPLPGVVGLLHPLHNQGWRHALVSSAARADIDAALTALSCAQLFQTIVGAEDVRAGKPDPEGSWTAAKRLGVPPDRCIIVDSYAAGIETAQRANMKSVLWIVTEDFRLPI